MSRKFTIVRNIDLNKLSNEIDEYIMQTGETNPYVFMHRETVEAIDESFPTSFTERPIITNSQCKVYRWEGYKVFVDNGLMFGEVEIR